MKALVAGAASSDVLGVDVSAAQGDLNWRTAVVHFGAKFAYIKATEGSYYTNPFFASPNATTSEAIAYSFADELGGHGVNVTVVHPALTLTERSVEQREDYLISDTVTLMTGCSGNRADLGQVFPHDVQRPAADDFTVCRSSNPELLNILVQGNSRLIQQATGPGVRVDQGPDRPYVRGPCPPDRIVHPGASVARPPSWSASGSAGTAHRMRASQKQRSAGNSAIN